MDMHRFAEFWKGMFYFVSTIFIGTMLVLVVFKWQPLWTDGFQDFSQISKAIMRLDRTAKPVAEMAPLMLNEMDQMRLSMDEIEASMKDIQEINPTMKEINANVIRMSWVMDQRMGHMIGEVNNMNDRMTPPGMMPFNW
jgi:hypothetical protein